MQFLKDLNIFHIDGKEIPCIAASGPPDHRYPGAPGVLYMDIDTGSLYMCTGANTIQKSYFWRVVGDVDAAVVQQAVENYIKENPVLGGGLTSAAATLLISILKNAVFTSNQSDSITALAEALAVSETDEPVIPDEPDTPDPVTYTVTNNLTNVNTSNSASKVEAAGLYSTTLTAADGYTLDSVTVTMGGVDITDTVYLEGSVSIATVSGDILITATAKALPVAVAMSSRVIDADNTSLYSDDGSTALKKGMFTYVVSEEVFTEDTELTVTIKTNGAMYSEAYGCSAGWNSETAKNAEKSGYYAELLFNTYIECNKAGTYTKTYTVKAGHTFALVNTAQSVAPITGVTVTK